MANWYGPIFLCTSVDQPNSRKQNDMYIQYEISIRLSNIDPQNYYLSVIQGYKGTCTYLKISSSCTSHLIILSIHDHSLFLTYSCMTTEDLFYVIDVYWTLPLSKKCKYISTNYNNTCNTADLLKKYS